MAIRLFASIGPSKQQNNFLRSNNYKEPQSNRVITLIATSELLDPKLGGSLSGSWRCLSFSQIFKEFELFKNRLRTLEFAKLKTKIALDLNRCQSDA